MYRKKSATLLELASALKVTLTCYPNRLDDFPPDRMKKKHTRKYDSFSTGV